MNQQAHACVAVDIVVPCYHEEEALPETHRQLSTLMSGLRRSGQISADSKIYYVDDGSRDGTWELIAALSEADDSVVGIRLSRNYGHQSALLAGLFSATGDAVITVDAAGARVGAAEDVPAAAAADHDARRVSIA